MLLLLLKMKVEKRCLSSTTTDDNGRFSTKVKSGYRLVFSFLAFDSLSVKVTKPSERMQIYLSPTENMLDETVVVGFKRVSKAAVTASVTVIKAEDLVNTPVANPMELLQGRVPGLNIQMNNGTPEVFQVFQFEESRIFPFNLPVMASL